VVPANACAAARTSAVPFTDECFDNHCAGGTCVCAAVFKPFLPGTSCDDVCQGFGHTCIDRFSDGPVGDRCAHYDASVRRKPCSVVDGNDDVCVCSTMNVSPGVGASSSPDSAGSQSGTGTIAVATVVAGAILVVAAAVAVRRRPTAVLSEEPPSDVLQWDDGFE
jgi:hypothetical protein